MSGYSKESGIFMKKYTMFQTIMNHRSIRNYKPEQISTHVLQEILKAGTRASTTGNMQVYSIIVTTEELLQGKIMEVHFRQNMVKQAPVCAHFLR